MKINVMRFIARLLLISFVILMATMFISCGALKHKDKKTEEIKVEQSSENNKEEHIVTSVKTEKNEAEKTEAKEKTTSVVYEGEPGDSLTVTEKNLTTGEVTETTYKGSGKLSKSDKETNVTSSKETDETSKQNITVDKAESDKSKLVLDTKKSEVHIDKKQNFNWWWLLLLLIPVFYYLNKRFKWLFWLSNYVTKFFGL